MQPVHPERHRTGKAVDFSGAGEETALESQHSFLSFAVYLGADDEQAVRVSWTGIARGIAAPHCYFGWCFLDDFEVVCDSRPGLVCGG